MPTDEGLVELRDAEQGEPVDQGGQEQGAETGPMIVARPPKRLTPPRTTAATELSRNEVLAAGSAAPTRATSRIAAKPARAPEMT